MGKIPSLIAYPIFRLTVSMVAGIFLFDQLMTEYGLSLPELILPVSGILFLIVCFLLVLYHCSAYRCKAWFGIVTAVAFLWIGGIRLAQERQQIDYVWSKEGGVYSGEVMTPPVRKGKMMQAEVAVKTMLVQWDTSKDTLEWVDIPTKYFSIHPISARQIPVQRTILLYWMPDSLQRSMACGDLVLFSSTITHPVSDEEITGFDYDTYLYRKGISGTAMAFKGDWKVYDRKKSLGLKQAALLCREWIVNCYRDWNLGSDEFAVVAALTVGDKSVLTSSLKEIYSAAGVSHVLALSGLHIGILSGILFFLFLPLKRFRHGDEIRSLMVVISLWMFAFVSGLSPSVVRAVTMCSLYFLGTCVKEDQFPGVYALVLAAFIMLIYQPMYLFDLSFQLSFLAVASILYFYPIVSGWVKVENKAVLWLWNGIAVSISAQLGTLPLILYYFGTFPTYFLLANMIVGVLAVCILCGAIVALVTNAVPFLGTLAVEFLNYVTLSLNQSIRWIQHLTGSQVDSLSISVFQAICGFIFLIGLYYFLQSGKRNSLIVLLSTSVMILADWAVHPLLPTQNALYFSHSHLYLRQNGTVEELQSANGLFTIDSLRVGVLNSERWSHRQALRRIPIDYLYISKGFHGNLKSLLRVFTIRQLILDPSLSPRYREYLKKECQEMKIPFTDISEKASFKILL